MTTTRVSTGLSWGVAPIGDEGWRWWIKCWGSSIAEGKGDTEKEARSNLRKVFAEKVLTLSQTQADKGKLRQLLKSWMKRRPYVVAHVLDGLTRQEKRGAVQQHAEEEERRRHDLDKAEAGFAWPIPAHHLTKKPEAVAGVVYDLCRELNLVGQRAFTYGKKMLGTGFTGSLDAETLAAMEEVAEQAAREDA